MRCAVFVVSAAWSLSAAMAGTQVDDRCGAACIAPLSISRTGSECVDENNVAVCRVTVGRCAGASGGSGLAACDASQQEEPGEAPEVTIARQGAVAHSGSPVTPSFTLTFLADEALAWGSLPGARFYEVPDFMKLIPTRVPEHVIPADSKIAFSCPKNGADCEATVLIYECKPCDNAYGGLPGLLLSQGWERSRCAPTFATGVANGIHHKMTAYRKVIPSPTVGKNDPTPPPYFFVTPGPVSYVAFGLTRTFALCADQHNQRKCEDNTAHRCAWDSKKSECVPETCIHNAPGPHLGCQHCVADEVPFR